MAVSCVIPRRIVNDTDVSEERVAFVLRMTELGSRRHRATLSMKQHSGINLRSYTLWLEPRSLSFEKGTFTFWRQAICLLLNHRNSMNIPSGKWLF